MSKLLRRQLLQFICLLVALVLIGCTALSGASTTTPSSGPTLALTTVFPGEITGWTPAEEARLYNRENIFNLVNGQAEAFFVYGFEQVAVQAYANVDKKQLNVEIWQLATPADAYGLFTFGRSGSSVNIGNEGDAEPGRRLSFWQDRYTVHVSARQEVDDALLWSFAQSVSTALPKGGEPPPLINRLPQIGLKEHDFIFFHEELSIQDRIWLGGENILGLSHDTNGVVASYELAGAPVLLLLIEYPTTGQAAAGVEALQTDQVTDLVTAQAQNNLLVAVFGEVDEAAVDTLVAKVLNSK
jgi:hypothetical protein